jgi:thymidine kinase
MANRQLEVITGCMFSGKTEELLRRLDRVLIAGRKVLLLKPEIDDRYKKDVVVTHYGREFPAIVVSSDKVTVEALMSLVGRDVLEEAAVVAFDEGNLFSLQLSSLCQDLVKMGKRVIVAGLDLTFAEEPFEPMPTLMALADRVDKLQAVCTVCGGVATRSQRLINGNPAPMNDPVIQIGGAGEYEARCRSCYIC